MQNNVINIKRPKAGTALERIAQRLRQKLTKTIEMPKREVEPSYIYEGRKRVPTVNTAMKALIERNDL
jgi:hypothetical protein